MSSQNSRKIKLFLHRRLVNQNKINNRECSLNDFPDVTVKLHLANATATYVGDEG
jgi:hypothetical protein